VRIIFYHDQQLLAEFIAIAAYKSRECIAFLSMFQVQARELQHSPLTRHSFDLLKIYPLRLQEQIHIPSVIEAPGAVRQPPLTA
jgi:hypothetical protein